MEILRNHKILFRENKITSKLFFTINKASKKLKSKEFIYEIDWDSMPGSHSIKIEKIDLTLPPKYASEYGTDNFNRLNELGLIELINHERNEVDGTDKYFYKLK